MSIIGGVARRVIGAFLIRMRIPFKMQVIISFPKKKPFFPRCIDFSFFLLYISNMTDIKGRRMACPISLPTTTVANF